MTNFDIVVHGTRRKNWPSCLNDRTLRGKKDLKVVILNIMIEISLQNLTVNSYASAKISFEKYLISD